MTTPRLPPPCPHLAAYSAAAAAPLRSLRRILRPRPPGRAEIRCDPGEHPRCPSCPPSSPPSPRLLACLACAAVSCSAHAHSHSALRPGHDIAIDVHRAELFCCACRDQVYHPDLDAAVLLLLSPPSPPPSYPPPKRRRAEYRPWDPDQGELALIRTRSTPLHLQDGVFCSGDPPPLWGLRGLNNLGNTCFMNSVLQALLHTPLMRNYFLSDRHNRDACRQRRTKCKTGGGRQIKRNGVKGGSQVCLVCDLDEMYAAVFSGEQKPYSPASFLYSWWQHASNLASYEQHDAHDFFISMLDGIHEKEQDQCRQQNQEFENLPRPVCYELLPNS